MHCMEHQIRFSAHYIEQQAVCLTQDTEEQKDGSNVMWSGEVLLVNMTSSSICYNAPSTL